VRVSASAGIGCGTAAFDAQPVRTNTGVSHASFEIMSGPFVDGALVGGNARGVGLVGSAGGARSCAIVGDSPGKRRVALSIELLETGALLLPVERFALLENEQGGERRTSGETGETLAIE
jgi:hypothetical protein